MKATVRHYFLIFLILILVSATACAVPQLKISDTVFNCSEGIGSSGFSDCNLTVYLKIVDYLSSPEYKMLKYQVKCEASFEYLTANSYFVSTTYDNDTVDIWGTNSTEKITLHANFGITINPVYNANVSRLSCKVINVSKY